MNRNDKNKKYPQLNINSVFRGKVVEPQNRSSYKLGGMQNIGKVSSMRRVPPPKWVPSLKAETGVSDSRQIINQPSSGWVSSASQDNGDSNGIRSQALSSKIGIDKSQWSTRLAANKPFFAIGQEFPSLPSDGSQEFSQDNMSKDSLKNKETESKTKIDDFRNRDSNISVSTLNRIDALSISKSSKGDIAATGWAAEDEEPNFDEKIIFSDDESSNEMQNWASDNEDGSKSDRVQHRESVENPPIISDVWHDQNQAMRFQSFQQIPMPMPVNVPSQFMASAQFSQNMLNRNQISSLANIMGDEQAAFLNSVAEQRNARNMEFHIAVERGRQKKLASQQSGRGSCGMGDEHNPMEQALMRSRHTSMTSDTAESMNTPIEMGPPGGPPLIHHLQKPHLQPQISQMMHPHNVSVISPSMAPPSLIRFAQHPYNIVPFSPMQMDHVDPKLMEKFVEFLKLQSASDTSQMDNSTPSDIMNQVPVQSMHETEMKHIDSMPIESDRPQSHVSSMGHAHIDKDSSISGEKAPSHASKENEPSERDFQRKTKSNYSYDDENIKYDSSKKSSNKAKSYKEYRPNKSNYKGGEYASNSDYYPDNMDDMIYKDDYNTYKQHYNRALQDYKPSRAYNNRGPNYNHYGSSMDHYSNQGRDSLSGDYQYKSNSLKSKSSKSKDNKSSGTPDHCQPQPPMVADQRDSNKKYQSENQDCWSSAADNESAAATDSIDKKSQPSATYKDKDVKKTGKLSKSVYTVKKSDNRNYKDKCNDSPQEYSMGFAVNPKDSKKNYYNNYNSRRYYQDYKYYNYPPSGVSSSSKYNEYENDAYYMQEYYPYDKDGTAGGAYSSGKFTNSNKRNTKNTSSDQWRSSKDEKSNTTNRTTVDKTHSDANSQSKHLNRNNRKTDKRQFPTSKDSNNDNDLDEWETASEGGSIRSNSAPKEFHKSHTRQSNSQLNAPDNGKPTQSNTTNDNRKVPINKNGSNYSCNGNSFNDNNGNQDGNGGASGSSGGNRFLSTNSRSSTSQNRSVDSSSQGKNVDKNSNGDNRNSDSTSKNCSNNNNINKDSSKFNESVTKPVESYRATESLNASTTMMNTENFSDIIEDPEFSFDNCESQFQEVLSKATKKNRKLQELQRQKDEIKQEQKRQEALKFKSKSDQILNNQTKKPMNKRDQLIRPSKCETGSTIKFDKQQSINVREKENSTNNTFKKWENTKVAMQIGSWDNSLADEISSEKKAPPKPIGTPASTVPWNKKVKGSFENNNSINHGQHSLSKDSSNLQGEIETINQTFIVSSDNNEVNFNTTMSYSYNNSIYNPAARPPEENKIEKTIESQAAEIVIHETINFEYDVKNLNQDKNHRTLLSADRSAQNNDQKLLNDKINSVKTIWDNQPTSAIVMESKVTPSSSITKDLDIHTATVSINQDASNARIIENSDTSQSAPIPNVCKVKPQLQHDFKKDHNEIILTSQAFPFRNSPAAFLSQSQGSFMPYRFPDFVSDPLHATDAFASLISNNQSGMHINYNLQNPHLIDSSLLRQNNQEQILSNKMNFINQTPSSFYPQQAPTPKLISNTPAQLPINMDLGSAHGPPHHHMQQLLLTRQNSLTSMMQPNPMTIPFIQSGQPPIQAQTPLFPNTPLLGATNFSSQINPFPQGHLQPHYPHGNFQSLTHHTPHFHHANQQMLLNQHPHQQQLIQAPLSHDRVINSGQSGVFNSVIGPSDISTNTGLPDFNGQPKPLNHHHNNIMHGMNGSAFMLPHNLNILMKPSMFATNSQYNNFTAPIQSNLLSLKSGFEHNSNLKSVELDHYKHENSLTDRNVYCGDNGGLPKSNDDYYQEVSEFDNCDISYDNWMSNLRYSKVDIYTNNLMSTLDFHSQKSPMQFSPMEASNDNAYRNYIAPFRDNQTSLPPGLQTNANLQYIISPRIKQQFNQDQSNLISRQFSKGYDNPNFMSTNNFINKNEFTDSNAISMKNTTTCSGTNSAPEAKDNLTKDVSNLEKSLADKKNLKQRTSYSDNFDEKNQSWSMIEDDRSAPLDSDNRSSLKSNNTEASSHSPNKPFNNSRSANNTFDNQCQYGYDETQLSSQTAESLGKFDHVQLKKVIMKLREGPVMTDTNCNGFDFTSFKGTATIPRLMPLQSSRNKPNSKSFNNNYNNCISSDGYGNGNDNVGLGFYSRKALTPPVPQFRSSYHRNKNANRNQNAILPNATTNSNSTNSSSTGTNVTINRVSRQKCDTIDKDSADSGDLKLNLQSKSLECDSLVLENIIDNPIL